MNQRNLIVLLTVFLVAIFISACGSSPVQKENADNNNKVKVDDEENNSKYESNHSSNDNDAENNNEEANKKNESSNNEVGALDEESSDDKESDALANYSSEEIEYARIWLQLGETQDIDELNVHYISSGEPLNTDDETSIDYPEDAVQLTGSRLAEGSVTYSSNGDGTIKQYIKVPQRWDGKNPAGKNTYKEIIEDTKQESIAPGDDEKVMELIKKINIES